MGLFGKRERYEDDEPDIYDEDEVDELIVDSALFVEAPPLESTTVSITPKNVYELDAGAWLGFLEVLPYDFRCYFDTRRAFVRAFEKCREEVVDFESYEGGRKAEYSESFEYDDHDVTIDFTLSRSGNNAPYIFTADIKIDE